MRNSESKISKGILPKLNRFVPPPGHPLQPYVDSIWSVHDKGTIQKETILPKGNLDIIFCLDKPHKLIQNLNTGKPINLDTCFLYGLKTNAFQTHPENHYSLFGVTLKMETCSAFLPLPSNELAGLPVDAKQIFPGADVIHEKLYFTLDFSERCKLLINWLYSLLKPQSKHKLINYVCTKLREIPAESKVREIARSLEISERHLRRLFTQHVGVSPASYLRLSRFIKSIHFIPGKSTLTEIAHLSHYTDQAHFCNDFKEIAGMTPKEYRNAFSGVPGHIFSA